MSGSPRQTPDSTCVDGPSLLSWVDRGGVERDESKTSVLKTPPTREGVFVWVSQEKIRVQGLPGPTERSEEGPHLFVVVDSSSVSNDVSAL